MINDNILLFILSIVLIYVFDHKILPTLGVVALIMIQMYINIVLNISTVVQTDALYAFMYVIAMIYGAYMILLAPIEADETNNQDVML
jgi:hypothetical protein